MPNWPRSVTAAPPHGHEHGELAELAPFGIAVLSITDPDGIQLELTAPLEPDA